MTLSVDELNAGTRYWEGTSWPKDLHNAFYVAMAEQNPHGNFNDDWWHGFLPHLASWRATRPRTLAFLTERARDRFSELQATWRTDCEPLVGIDAPEVPWGRVASFASVVAEIKDVTSPVFTSKFCHFLLPQVFPVVDNAAMGNRFRTYQAYFEFASEEWAGTPVPVRTELCAVLRARVPGMAPSYPVRTKVIELCLIGRRRSQAS
jgi:hypothetical protein